MTDALVEVVVEMVVEVVVRVVVVMCVAYLDIWPVLARGRPGVVGIGEVGGVTWLTTTHNTFSPDNYQAPALPPARLSVISQYYCDALNCQLLTRMRVTHLTSIHLVHISIQGN